MIVSDNQKAKNSDFENLLFKTKCILEGEVINSPELFSRSSALEFEMTVLNAMCDCANGTKFAGSIHLISGHKFPDIIANSYYGVEVKTTKQNHWKTVGNSVLESTRVDGVEKIYLMFGKLVDPIKFMFRKYQDCLYDVAVTHSPRYLIDMNLKVEKSIFSKMGITYDDLRKLENPINPVVEYYKRTVSQSSSLWWINGDEEKVVPMEMKMWSSLNTKEKRRFVAKAMVLFPEVLSKTSPTKYDKVAAWLIKEHGIVSSSLRDQFSAGGKVTIEINSIEYKGVPKVFERLIGNIDLVSDALNSLTLGEMLEYWKLPILESKDVLTVYEKYKVWEQFLGESIKSGLEETTLDCKTLIEYIRHLIHVKNTRCNI